MERKRKENWTKSEVDVLRNSYVELQSTIDGRLGPGLTLIDKHRAWETVLERVNAQGRCIRTLKEVKKKLADLKTTLKKRERERRQLLFKTGGGPPPAPLCMDDEKLLGVIGEVSTFGFDGFDTFDYMDSSDTRSNNEKECLTESNPASKSSTAIIEENDDLTEKQILLQILKEQKKMNELLSKHFSVST